MFCAPGNAGTAEIGENVAISVNDLAALVRFARENRVDLSVVGPDDLPLALVELLADETERCALGRRGLETLESQRGATQFTLQQLHTLLPSNTREANPA